MAEKEKPVIITLPPFEQRHAENEPAFLFAKHTRRIIQATPQAFDDICQLEANRRHGYTVLIGNSDRWFPLAIVRGAHPGPCVTITAGIHANEACGIKAALELSYELDFASLHGTACLVPMANTAAFNRRGTSMTVGSERNLNRMFPGNALSADVDEQLAAGLWELIELADAHIDLHSGDAHEALAPHAYVLDEGPAAEKSWQLARCVDVPFVVPSASYHEGAAYLTAAKAGIPSVLIERGGCGRWEREDVDAMKADVLNILRSLGMLPGSFQNHQVGQTVLSKSHFDSSLYSGIWQPLVHAGDPVDANQLLGTVTDPFGNTLSALTAAEAGVVLYVVESLNLIEGETAVAYAGK